MPHLPYAFDDDDEFFHPAEGWLLIDRTIVFDSWILWRHALPITRWGRSRLDDRVVALITALAERIHAFHQQLPGYSSLDDTPFVFSRWWDPVGEGEWGRGGSCVFRIDGHTNRRVLDAFRSTPGMNHLELTELSGDRFRARLIGEEVDAFNSGQSGLPLSLPPVGRPQRKPQPRKPRILLH